MTPTLLLLAGLTLGQPGGAGEPPPGAREPGNAAGEPLNITVVAPKPPEQPPATAPNLSAAGSPARWLYMRSVQGSWLGALFDDNRTSLSGWVEQSFTGSTAKVSNQPVVWNDRANRYLLNQAWFRLERSVVTTGTLDPTWGYRIDADYGTDYRYSQMRGFLNNQLLNSQGNQNLYGVDLIQFYSNVYIPTLFQGTDIRVGRLFTPFGYESLEGISTPFVSRSYAFNWSPPFTHMGIMVSPQFNAQWSGRFMLANGNDVFIGDPAEELRFVGALTWVAASKRDTATFGWSLGRGKFNAGDTFNPATVGEQSEPAGRNNLNVVDWVYAHVFTPRFNCATELIYGWQYGVPANMPGGIISENVTNGTAHWGSWVQYWNYSFTSKLTGIVRFELFDDFQGQRTGFEGLYTAITGGFQYRPTPAVMIRSEVRFDYNGYSTPFEGKHGILTSAIDVIYRW
jgi:hypothetical protein